MEVSLPNTVGKFVQLAAYILLPTVAAKLLRSIKVTPVACALLIVSIFGILVSTNLTVITVARGLLAAIMGFLSMHVQSDCALVSRRKPEAGSALRCWPAPMRAASLQSS